jgi:hypothetical protein
MTRNTRTKVAKRVSAILGARGAMLLAMVLMLGTVAVSFSQATSGAVNGALSIYGLVVNPQPVVAGASANITFQLFNSYASSLSNVNLQLTSSSPILNVSPSSTYVTSVIGAGDYGSNGFNAFHYKIHVPSTLPAGEYTIDVIATYDAAISTSGTVVNEPGQSIMPIQLYIYGTPSIQISANPQGTLLPGSLTAFTISTLNTGTDTARNVTILFLNSTGFSPSGSPVIQFGIMAPGAQQTGQETLLVSQNLPVGTVYIDALLNYTAQNGEFSSIPVNIPISYVSPTPHIIASIVSASPQQLYAGGNQTLVVSIQNTGYGAATNLTASFLSTGAIRSKGSASSFYIGTLNAGASVTEDVLISANNTLSSTSYSLPVLFSYQNSNHVANYSYTYPLKVNLQNSSIFNVTSVQANLAVGGTYLPVIYTIRNTGNEPAQQLSLSLQTTYPVSPASSTFYISQLLPGQSANATFYVDVDSLGANGNYPVTIYEQWKQPNGYTSQQFSSLSTYYAPVGIGAASGGFGSIDLIAIVVVIIIVAVALYRFGIISKVVPRTRAATEKKKNKK